MVNKQKIEFIKIDNINKAVGKNKMYLLKLPSENTCSLIITDLNGVKVPLKDLTTPFTGVQTVSNSDGNLQIVGANNILINISPSLLSTITTALQTGDNISELLNDAGYLLISDLDGDKLTFNNRLTDGDFLFAGDITQYTDENAQDAVGNILVDTPTIDLNYNDGLNTISANLKVNSITENELSNSINISSFVNDEGFIDHTDLSKTQNPTNVVIHSDTGTDATILLANGINAGVTENNFTLAEKTNLSNQSGTNTGDNSPNSNSNSYADSLIVQTISNGDTTHTPSSDTVYDELQLKENTVNKTTTVVGNEASNVLFGTIKAIVDWVTSFFVPKTRTLTIGTETFDLSADRTFTGDFLSNDETTYTDATLPLAGTELALVNQGGNWKKVEVSEFGGGGIESIVAGTNITVDDTDPLNPIVSASSGGEDFIQSQWIWQHFITFGTRNGIFNTFNLSNGTVSGVAGTSQIPNYQNIQQFNSSTFANSGYRILTIDFSSGDGSSRFSKQIGLTYFATFCIYANSSADTIIRLGYMSSINTADSNVGAYIEITANSVVFKTASVGVRSSSSSATLAYSNSTTTEIPYDVLIHFDSLTQVSCKIVRHDGTVMLNTTLTTNIPTLAETYHAGATGFIVTAGVARPIFGIQKIGLGTKKPNFLNSF